MVAGGPIRAFIPRATLGSRRANETARELQRRRDRDPDHDHGARFAHPAGTSWHALGHELPVLLAYVLSFLYLGIYWNNHHHMLAAVSRVSGATLWANLHLLFWLSLVPFSTAWMSEHHFPPIPTAIYGVVLLAAAIAYYILQTTLLRAEGEHSRLRVALGSDLKGKISPLLYCLGIGVAFADRWIGLAVYIAVALIWLVPDRRVERHLTAARTEPTE
jgi:uncharacterized membrane protein